jgi:DNA-binding NtrC family response regulator
MQEVFSALERFARADVSISLMGETGVGKEVLALAVHERSGRADRPLVVFDCASVATNLAESELLGHERGAFTGAVSAHPGAFERAEGGTLFLDEVGELPLDLQTRLLRALDNRGVRRVGGRGDFPVNVRVIAATNRDLQSEVAAGRFRADLYYRLAVAVVRIPPLRDRLEDLPDLVRALLTGLGRPGLRVSEATFEALRAWHWPGNVRELRNALACAVTWLDADARALEPHHLNLRHATNATADETFLETLPLGGQPLERLERVAIRQTLHRVGGNRTIAARVLGIALSTLHEKMKKYDIRTEGDGLELDAHALHGPRRMPRKFR